jgi:pimeloyl-ACP methyl ester carboxylesterase
MGPVTDEAQAVTWLAALEARAQRQAVPFGPGQVTWRRFGDGPPLVLLHGGHGSWLHWARNIPAWSGRFTVGVPDLPGCGDSDAPAAPTLDALLDALLATLDRVVPREAPMRLAGFSFGGLVAAHLAVRRGGVTHLALLGPAGHGGARRPRGELRAWRDLPTGSEAWQATMRHNLAMHMLHGDAAIDALALRIHGAACLRTRFHSKPISRAGGLGPLLDSYRGDVLLAWGEHDVTADPEAAARTLAGGHPQRRACIVPGGGHWVQYECAGEVNDMVQAWLEAPGR